MFDSWEVTLLKSGFEKFPCRYRIGKLNSPFFQEKFRPWSEDFSPPLQKWQQQKYKIQHGGPPYTLFKRGPFLVCYSRTSILMDTPTRKFSPSQDHLMIFLKLYLLINKTINDEFENFNSEVLLLFQAFSDRSVLPLCMGISWAEKVVKLLMQNSF